LIAAVLIGGAFGGALVGGVAMGRDQGREEAARDLQAQMGQFVARPSAAGTQQETPQQGSTPSFGDFGGLMGRGGTMGSVVSIEGSTLTVATMGGSVTVLTGNSTSIQVMGEGSLDDIVPGNMVTITGEENAEGMIEATAISIVASAMGPGFRGR
jgi:hypothetical protein